MGEPREHQTRRQSFRLNDNPDVVKAALGIHESDEANHKTGEKYGERIRIKKGEKSEYQKHQEEREARLAEFMEFVKAKVEKKKLLLEKQEKEQLALLDGQMSKKDRIREENKLWRQQAELRKLGEGSIPKISEGAVEHESIEGREAFRKMADVAIDYLVTHGMVVRKGDKWVLENFSDSDGNMCMYLCRLAGLKTAKIEYVNKGGTMAGALVADTSPREEGEGGVEGVKFDPLKHILYIDHHGDSSPSGSSASEYVYDVFFGAGLVEPTMELEGAIEFVRAADNGFFLEDNPYYQGFHKEFLNFHKTMAGLSRFLRPEEIVAFFREFRDPLKVLSSSDMAKWQRAEGATSIEDRSEQMRTDANVSLREMVVLMSKGFVLESDDYGKILVDPGKKVKMGSQAAFGMGFDVYVAWNPAEKSYVIQSREKTLNITLPQGIEVRGRMLLKPMNDGEELKMSLSYLLSKLMGGDFVSEKGLAKYLEVEAEGKGEVVEGKVEKSKSYNGEGTKAFFDTLRKLGFGMVSDDQPEEKTEKVVENNDDEIGKIMDEWRKKMMNVPETGLKDRVWVRRHLHEERRKGKWFERLFGKKD